MNKKIIEKAYLKAYIDIFEKDPIKRAYLKSFIDSVPESKIKTWRKTKIYK